MDPTLAAAAVVVAAALLLVAALALHRRRLDKRFARKLSPYERRRLPGGEVLDPEEWVRR